MNSLNDKVFPILHRFHKTGAEQYYSVAVYGNTVTTTHGLQGTTLCLLEENMESREVADALATKRYLNKLKRGYHNYPGESL
jgi:hypothetical protein